MEPPLRRIRFSAAVSLDGYVAGPNGESDWIVMDPDIDFGALMSAFNTILLGRKTYEATRQHGGSGMPGMHAYVFSRTLRQEDCPGVTVSRNPQETIAGSPEDGSRRPCRPTRACSSRRWRWRRPAHSIRQPHLCLCAAAEMHGVSATNGY